VPPFKEYWSSWNPNYSAIEQAIERQGFTLACFLKTKEFLESRLLVPQWKPTPGIVNLGIVLLQFFATEPIQPHF